MILPLIIGMLLGGVVGVIAEQKNRAFFPWAIYGFFFFFLAIIHIAVIGDKAYEDRQLEGMGYKKCPACAEMVKSEAVFCKHCRTSLSPNASSSESDAPKYPCRWCKQDLIKPEVNTCPACGGVQKHFLKDNPTLVLLLMGLIVAFFIMISQVEMEGPRPPVSSSDDLSSF